ncbi:Hypothetical protein ABZS17I87_01171 [Kosakonia cowanii]
MFNFPECEFRRYFFLRQRIYARNKFILLVVRHKKPEIIKASKNR